MFSLLSGKLGSDSALAVPGHALRVSREDENSVLPGVMTETVYADHRIHSKSLSLQSTEALVWFHGGTHDPCWANTCPSHVGSPAGSLGPCSTTRALQLHIRERFRSQVGGIRRRCQALGMLFILFNFYYLLLLFMATAHDLPRWSPPTCRDFKIFRFRFQGLCLFVLICAERFAGS